MSLKDSWNNPEKQARLDMETAENSGKRAIEQADKPERSTSTSDMPRRYRLYDKLNVSVRTMDIIIYAISALLILCLIVGILTGNRT